MANSGPNGEWLATTPEYWSLITRPILAFQIWYADGACVRGTPEEWGDAPVFGVQVVMLHHLNGDRHVIAGKDEYALPGRSSKLGLEIDETRFYHILKMAMEDEWRP